MKIFVAVFVVVFLVKDSHCGGSTKIVSPEELMKIGQASDMLSEFSSTVLKTVQDHSDELNNIAKHRDDPDFSKIHGRALKKNDILNKSTKHRIFLAFQELVDDLSNLIGVDSSSLLDVLNDPSAVTENIAVVIEFLKTAELTLNSAQSAVDGQGQEFLLNYMYSNKVQEMKHNSGEC